MAKQLAILIDASGSMFHSAGNGSSKDKIVEASESVQYIIDEIENKTSSSDETWAVSFWYFATQSKGLIGQGNFPVGDTTAWKNVVSAIEDQPSVQAAVGSMTDIFHAVRTVADFMVANPPPLFPAVYKKKIVLFTDGNQTIQHDSRLTKGGYEFEQGIDFAVLLAGNGIALNAQGIGSDLLNATLTDLAAEAEPFGSTVKTISTTPSYAADTSAALMTNSMKVVNNNGILPLRPLAWPASRLLWEQFSLPRLAAAGNDEGSQHRVNEAHFEVDVDDISQELLLGLTWHHPGRPSIEATSPSGTSFRHGLNGAFEIGVGWMTALHIPSPEAGTWRVRVAGDPQFRPLRLNLMARSVSPEFDILLRVDPFQLDPQDTSVVTATPMFRDKPATGKFEAVLSDFTGRTWPMHAQQDGTLVAKADFPQPGIAPLRVELKGLLEGKHKVARMEFTSVQVGRPRDPRLTVEPARFRPGRRYRVAVTIHDAAFSAATQIAFGAGIEVVRFTVLSPLEAIAEISVANDAFPGAREVLTFQPDAETLGGIVVEKQPGSGHQVLTGFVTALRFDARGRLLAAVLDERREVLVKRHDERLRRLLEKARDDNLPVSIALDDHGGIEHVTIGE
ncbi:vWA domain-containing protein [Cupriavidus oxalaticus]|uniref:vWA domain-containing protein n=1 Tax=Cupriavidus oxalaticus TaxID=96344 RepID=UPI004033E3CA